MYGLYAAESDADSAGSEDKPKSCTVCTQEDVIPTGFNALFSSIAFLHWVLILAFKLNVSLVATWLY